ncbi:histidinol-phosphate aminotransferase [Actinobaculum suis]|uniref:Aminotransferase n=2 Tax=Actinobaculum suis TaxID=1657 RepID=A0A1G6Z7Q1_9ACTO|nr:histidinol-phosphate aminotransferase [Actinobaculum suis]VDG76696.1 aminotransferase [Actinobaculum suis]
MISMDRNTSPVSPFTAEDFLRAARETPVQAYPQGQAERFKAAYAAYYELDPAGMELANGSDEWIQKVILTLGGQGVVFFAPDFGMYQQYCEDLGRAYYPVPARENLACKIADMQEVIARKRPSLAIISYPHNPTGAVYSADELENLAQSMAAQGGWLVIDECYVEFAAEYRRPRDANVIYLRTLSKVYGMAGLRLGIALGRGQAFQRICRVNHPYPVNSLVLNLAAGFFEDPGRVREFVDYQRASQTRLKEAFQKVADLVKVFPTQANYVLTGGPRAGELANFLAAQGFRGRTYGEDPLLAGYARYSVIRLEEYPALETALATWRNTCE